MPRSLFALLLLLLPSASRAGEEAVLGYCYRTLADIVCYPEPDAGRERRFVGAFPLPPGWRRIPVPPAPPRAQAREARGPRCLGGCEVEKR